MATQEKQPWRRAPHCTPNAYNLTIARKSSLLYYQGLREGNRREKQKGCKGEERKTAEKGREVNWGCSSAATCLAWDRRGEGSKREGAVVRM